MESVEICKKSRRALEDVFERGETPTIKSLQQSTTQITGLPNLIEDIEEYCGMPDWAYAICAFKNDSTGKPTSLVLNFDKFKNPNREERELFIITYIHELMHALFDAKSDRIANSYNALRAAFPDLKKANKLWFDFENSMHVNFNFPFSDKKNPKDFKQEFFKISLLT